MKSTKVAVGTETAERERAHQGGESPDLRVEKDAEGIVSSLIIHCPCGETIHVNCLYRGEKGNETVQT
jgi:hypothetical protein